MRSTPSIEGQCDDYDWFTNQRYSRAGRCSKNHQPLGWHVRRKPWHELAGNQPGPVLLRLQTVYDLHGLCVPDRRGERPLCSLPNWLDCWAVDRFDQTITSSDEPSQRATDFNRLGSGEAPTNAVENAVLGAVSSIRETYPGSYTHGFNTGTDMNNGCCRMCHSELTCAGFTYDYVANQCIFERPYTAEPLYHNIPGRYVTFLREPPSPPPPPPDGAFALCNDTCLAVDPDTNVADTDFSNDGFCNDGAGASVETLVPSSQSQRRRSTAA